jgi:replicative DNA helicase
MTIATNAATAGFPVGVISLEMGDQMIGLRSVSSLSGVELLRLRKGLLRREDYSRVTSAIGRLASLPIFFSFSSWELDQIRRVITEMVQARGVKLVILDYLQLARNGRQKVREREIGEISTTLKQLAMTFQIPILALSQLSRKVEDREDKRPRLSDLRDSGQIEQDADVVMFLHREDPTARRGPVELIFAKGRNIGLGAVKLYFDGDLMTFKDFTETK